MRYRERDLRSANSLGGRSLNKHQNNELTPSQDLRLQYGLVKYA
jgi:hypothetical protein